jgi:Ca2+/Na+ antiporter
MLKKLLEASPAAATEEMAAADSNSTMILLGGVVGFACIVVGIVLLVANKEFLQNNAFFNGGKSRKGGALITYRFAGLQMLAMGILLLLFVAGMVMGNGWLSLICLVLVVALPFVCSSYMKRSKRFK